MDQFATCPNSWDFPSLFYECRAEAIYWVFTILPLFCYTLWEGVIPFLKECIVLMEKCRKPHLLRNRNVCLYIFRAWEMVCPRQMLITSLLNEIKKQSRGMSTRWSNKYPSLLSPPSTTISWHPLAEVLWDSGRRLWNFHVAQDRREMISEGRLPPRRLTHWLWSQLYSWEQLCAPYVSATAQSALILSPALYIKGPRRSHAHLHFR